MLFPLPEASLRHLIDKAFEEDLGDAGDLTTLATVDPHTVASATLNTRKAGVAAGIPVVAMAFRHFDASIEVLPTKLDGEQVASGDTLLEVRGPAQSLLTAERVALNTLCHMSGIATATRALVDAVDGTGVKIACTRKTHPGLRAIQKYAVRCGGGGNHRFGLHDAVMIKDNHIIAAGGIPAALRRVKERVGHTVSIEIEVDTLEQLAEVLREGADIALLDNMSPEMLREAVKMARGQLVLEASGNVTVESARAIAETGVDIISSGWITHSAPTLDIGMELSLEG